MRLIASRPGKGKTNEMLRQFVKVEGAWMFSSEITLDDANNKLKGIDLDEMTLEQKSHFLYVQRDDKALARLDYELYNKRIRNTTIFVDGMHLFEDYSVGELKKFCFTHNVDLVITVQCNANVKSNDVQQIDL